MSSSLINRTKKKIRREEFVPALLRYVRRFDLGDIFSDTARKAELLTRLKSIERCINNDEKLRQVNAEFCRRAFSLMADCGLITQDNIQFLASAEACESYDRKLKFPFNRSEGVLRKVERDDDIYDANHVQRFYRGDKMCVICGGTKYLIANNWFAEGGNIPSNKRAFYNWLTMKVLDKKAPAEMTGAFLFAETSSIFAGDLDKAESVFNFTDVQALDEVVHFLSEGTDFSVADDVIDVLVA